MDSTYAPQSPDLSSFLSPPNPQQHHQPRRSASSSTQSTPYAPRSPVIPATFGTTSSAQPVLQHQHFSYQQNQQLYPSGLGAFEPTNEFSEYGGIQYMPPIPALPPTHSFANNTTTTSTTTLAPQYYPSHPVIKSEASHYINSPVKSDPTAQYYNNNNNNTPPTTQTFPLPAQPFSRTPSPIKPNLTTASYHNQAQAPSPMSTRPSRQPHVPYQPAPIMQNDLSAYPSYLPAPAPMNHPIPPAAPAKNPNPDNIEIRTKFPVARIKRIMQADEEVGKVAQVTPVAVSKALELFMISLVQGAARVAREKGGKRVTAQCLKRVVEGDEQFDFLSEIVGRVQDVQEDKEKSGEGKGRRKRGEGSAVKEEVGGSETEEEGEEKKKRKGKGRRKKSEE
ncbi:CBF NF-Y family transcription factor protein [Rutstroemia sp. NJR-2017a WRK4]|nr:CBF NF-Y family transcription factor protein [Rutstroemia sp. NJR-2017a WRK4]